MSHTYNVLPGTYMPLVISPQGDNSLGGLTRYVNDHRQELEDNLTKFGALLFRGYLVQQAEHFHEFVSQFKGDTLNYYGGSVPRGRVTSKVFNATELTRHFRLNLHNELAYQETFPDKLFFYCQTPSATGGETFIADNRRVLRDLPETVVSLFDKKHVRYVRIYQDLKPLREKIKQYAFFYQHLTWQVAMQAETREEAEQRCKDLNLEFKWRSNGDLEVWNVLPALKLHPITGERVWFNQVLLQNFNPMTYGRLGYSIRRALYIRDRNMPNNSYFGDGSPIPRQIIRSIYEAGNRNTVYFPWESGDIMLLDNHSVAHGRNPFAGERKVLVSMIRQPEIYTPYLFTSKVS